MQNPDYDDQRPYGGGYRQNGNTQRPYNNGPRPYGEGQRPYNNGPRPYNNGPRPYGEGPRPYNNGPRPYGEGQRPYGEGPRPNLSHYRPAGDAEAPAGDSLYSRTIKAGKRMYYIDVKRDRRDELFVALTESKRVQDATDSERPVFEKHKIFLYREDLLSFLTALTEAVQCVGENRPISARRLFAPQPYGPRRPYDGTESAAPEADAVPYDYADTPDAPAYYDAPEAPSVADESGKRPFGTDFSVEF